MAIPMSDGQLPYTKKKHLKVYYLSSVNVYMSNTYKVYIREIRFFTYQQKGIGNVPNLRYHGKNQTISNFTLKMLFPNHFFYFMQTSILIFHTNDTGNRYQC